MTALDPMIGAARPAAGFRARPAVQRSSGGGRFPPRAPEVASHCGDLHVPRVERAARLGGEFERRGPGWISCRDLKREPTRRTDASASVAPPSASSRVCAGSAGAPRLRTAAQAGRVGLLLKAGSQGREQRSHPGPPVDATGARSWHPGPFPFHRVSRSHRRLPRWLADVAATNWRASRRNLRSARPGVSRAIDAARIAPCDG